MVYFRFRKGFDGLDEKYGSRFSEILYIFIIPTSIEALR